MCTLTILLRKEADWPLLLAANRDEMTDRPFKAPAFHWRRYPKVIAGMDCLAGGTWLGYHEQGLIVAMLNRKGSLGPLAGKRSRGLLALEVLEHGSLAGVKTFLNTFDPLLYRPFNMVMADPTSAWWVRWDGALSVVSINQGFSILGEGELNDTAIHRTGIYLEKFQAASLPDPAYEDYTSWQSLLLQRAPANESPRDYLYLTPQSNGYGTTSSSILALSRKGDFRWRYREDGEWQRVSLTKAPIRFG